MEPINPLRFRASGAANLMTNKQGASITEKQLELLANLQAKLTEKGSITEKQTETYNELVAKRDSPFELSDTAKSWVEKLWRKKEKGVEEFLANKYIEKGLSEEEMGISLCSAIDGNYYKKNEEERDNGVLTGTPDIVFGDESIDDIKSSWDLKTFMNADMTDLYYGQLQVYMELWDINSARLRYCLVDTPQKLINDAKRQVMWKLDITDDENPEFRHIFQQIETNMIFSHYPKHERVKTFHVKRDRAYIDELYVRAAHAIDYYESLRLGGEWNYTHNKNYTIKMKKLLNKILQFFTNLFSGKTEKIEGKTSTTSSSKRNDKPMTSKKRVALTPVERKYNLLANGGLTPRDTKKGRLLNTSKKYQKAPTPKKVKEYGKWVVRTEKPLSHYAQLMMVYKAKMREYRDEGKIIKNRYWPIRNKYGMLKEKTTIEFAKS